jgi:hypothetical protein
MAHPSGEEGKVIYPSREAAEAVLIAQNFDLMPHAGDDPFVWYGGL